MDPTIAVLYVNRALCGKKRGDWERVLEDAGKALQLDANNMKVLATRPSTHNTQRPQNPAASPRCQT
jgi:hypothetical protein